MQKIIAFLLVFLFLCANTSMGQLWKIPNLVEHYNEHKNDKEFVSFSFMDFVKMHYAKNSEHQHEDHHELPFKTIENSPITLFIISFSHYQISSIKTFISFKKNFFYHKNFKSNTLNPIWLPPKLF